MVKLERELLTLVAGLLNKLDDLEIRLVDLQRTLDRWETEAEEEAKQAEKDAAEQLQLLFAPVEGRPS